MKLGREDINNWTERGEVRVGLKAIKDILKVPKETADLFRQVYFFIRYSIPDLDPPKRTWKGIKGVLENEYRMWEFLVMSLKSV